MPLVAYLPAKKLRAHVGQGRSCLQLDIGGVEQMVALTRVELLTVVPSIFVVLGAAPAFGDAAWTQLEEKTCTYFISLRQG